MQVIALLLCLIVIVQAQRILYGKLWENGLRTEIAFGRKNMLEDETVQVDVTVENDKWLPLPALSVSFSLPQEFMEVQTKQKNLMNTFHRNELFTLYSHQRVRRSLTFTCRQRGVYTIREVMLLNRSLLMDREDTRLLPLDKQIVVYPRCVNMRLFTKTFQNIIGELLTNNFMNEDVFLIRSIRDYQPYDSQRSINWKGTAKLGRLMVNNYEYTDSRKVAVFLNLTQSELRQEKQVAEESIRLAKTWCVSMHKYGIACDLYTNGKESQDGEYLHVEKEGREQNYIYHVNETLARIAVCPDEGNFSETFAAQIAAHERDCYLVFISADYREAFQQSLCGLLRRTNRFLWVLPKTGTGSYRVLPQLSSRSVGWNVYWRKEERCEAIRA